MVDRQAIPHLPSYTPIPSAIRENPQVVEIAGASSSVLLEKYEQLNDDIQNKFREMQRECLDLALRRQYLKGKEANLRKNIDFYRTALLRISNTFDIDIDP